LPGFFQDAVARRADEWIERVKRGGFRAVLIGRLVPGLRVAMSLVAGTAHVPVPQFSARGARLRHDGVSAALDEGCGPHEKVAG
jgi:hypothetical protein